MIFSILVENTACELSLFSKIRNFDDGITYFEFVINKDTYDGDHKPSFNINLLICNYMVIEFNIYNINHTK